MMYAFFSRYDMQPPLQFTYALDGSTIRNAVMLGDGVQEQVSRARWDEATLVITTDDRHGQWASRCRECMVLPAIEPITCSDLLVIDGKRHIGRLAAAESRHLRDALRRHTSHV